MRSLAPTFLELKIDFWTPCKIFLYILVWIYIEIFFIYNSIFCHWPWSWVWIQKLSLCICKQLVFLSGVWMGHLFGVLHYIVTNLINCSEWIVADCWQLIWEKACNSERKSKKCRSRWLHLITSILEGFQLLIIAFVFVMFSTLSRDILEPH